MTGLGTETNQTHRQMAQIIDGLHRLGKPGLADSVYVDMFRSATELHRTTYYELLSKNPVDSVGKLVKHKPTREAFEKAFKKYCILRGDAAYQAWMDRAYQADHTQLESECAAAWCDLATAMDEKTPPGIALCLGIGVQKVFWNWQLNPQKGKPPRPPEENRRFRVSDDEVRENVILLIERLQKILQDHPKAPANLFFPAEDNQKLIDTSYRFLRARFANDVIGWAYKTAPSDADRASGLEKVYRKGEFSSDLQWLAPLQPDEIAWRNGPFMLASHASDWTEAARTLERLLHCFPKFLETSVSDLTALADDLDAWPGLAAAYYTTQNGDLDGLRGKIDQLRQKDKKLDVVLTLAEQDIRSGHRYATIIAHIRQKGLVK